MTSFSSARKNDLKIVVLWFGSWKNSMSCYAPSWVKTNPETVSAFAHQRRAEPWRS